MESGTDFKIGSGCELAMIFREEFDVVIIGSGIIGLTSGVAVLENNPKLKVLVVDKEQKIGEHASGRNSGVLHAGFYYSPDSLKAKFCKDGNIEMRNFAKKFGIPIMNCGKVVVTKNESEEIRIHKLFQRGIENGVELELLEASKLVNYESTAKTKSTFIWSPNTAVLEPRNFLAKLLEYYLKLGGKIAYESKVHLIVKESSVIPVTGNYIIQAKKVINAAGAHADRIAKSIGVGNKYAAVPFKGNYRKSTSNSQAKTLIYPVPHEINPFLGVHTTLTTDGKIKIGPTAIFAMGRENYKFLQNVSLKEVSSILNAIKPLIASGKHNVREIAFQELPLISENGLTRAAGRISTEISRIESWVKTPSGIRSQLVNLDTGELVQDFVVEEFHNSMHFLNVVSPGWTSSFPFTRYFVSQFMEK